MDPQTQQPLATNAAAATPAAPVPTPAPSADDLKKLSDDLKSLATQAAQTQTEVAAEPVAPVVMPAAEAPVVSAPVAPMSAEEIKPTMSDKVQPEQAPVGQFKVTMYTTPACQYCKAEKEYLSQQGIAFVERNVEQNEADLREMLNVSDNFAGVPVTVIENPTGQKLVVKGFTQTDFEEEARNFGLIKGEKTTKPEESMTSSAPAPMAVEPPTAPMTPSEPTAPAAPVAPPVMPDLN